ncbi:MAG: helix-turn-helix domain-containing protein [Bacteroidia bacterium]
MIEIPLKTSVVLIGTVIAQGFFAALLLLIQQNNLKANKYLGLLLLTFSLWLCDTFFNISTIYQQNPNFYFLPIYFSLAFGPLVYFYTLAITDSRFTFSFREIGHFLPVLIQASLYVFLQLRDYEFRRWFWLEVHRPITYDLEFNLSLISLILYLFLSIRLIVRYQKWLNNHFSEVSKISLNWLKIVQSLMIVMSLLWLADLFVREIWQYYADQRYSAIGMGISILALAAGGLMQANLRLSGFSSETEEKNPATEVIIDTSLVEKIKTEMAEGEYYLNPDLTLEAFARQLKLPSRLISAQINQGFGIPFIDFVNQYRVEKVKRHIQDKDLQHMTLLGIALESGFNSKSTFNRVFKKFTGKSPSEYQKLSQNVS